MSELGSPLCSLSHDAMSFTDDIWNVWNVICMFVPLCASCGSVLGDRGGNIPFNTNMQKKADTVNGQEAAEWLMLNFSLFYQSFAAAGKCVVGHFDL